MITDLAPAFRPIDADLSVWRHDRADETLFYAPGYVAVVDAGCVPEFAHALETSALTRWPALDALREHAAAQDTWRDLVARPFAPVCLTLYLNNECNLHCRYCFSDPGPQRASRLALPVVRSAAEIVATHCRAQNRPLTVVFHGGGEPLLDAAYAGAVLETVEAAAAAHGLGLFRYIATNGVMSPALAAWMAAHFDLIGLSCDGPPGIQGMQRPLRDGRNSAPYVEQTAQIVHASGTPLHVRVTVTAESAPHQDAIAAYVCQQLRPQEIHVEPVYGVGRARDEVQAQADAFVTGWLRGQAVARQHGIPWRTSGSRPGEIHGPYCQVYRDVLHLVPPGTATACLTTTTGAQAQARSLAVGGADTVGALHLDTARIEALWPQIPAGRLQQEDVAFGQWPDKTIGTLMYVIDNEIHHRGQGYVYLRALGIEPPAFYDR